MDLQMLALDLDFLSVLRSLQENALVKRYKNALCALSGTPSEFASAYGALCAQVYETGDPSRVLLHSIHRDSNALTDTIDRPSEQVMGAVNHDVRTLCAMLSVSGSELLDTAKSIFGQALPNLYTLPTFRAGTSPAFFRRGGPAQFLSGKRFWIFCWCDILCGR